MLVKQSKRALFLAFCLVLLTGCQSFQQLLQRNAPKITYQGAALDSIDLEGVNVKFDFQIQNKVDVPVEIKKIQFTLFLEGKKLTTLENTKPISLQGKKAAPFDINQRFEYREVYQSVKDLLDEDTVTAGVEGVATVRIPQLNQEVSVSFSGEKEFPVPKAPKIEFAGLKVGNINPLAMSAGFELSLKLSNPNPFNLDIKGLNYAFNALGSNIAGGNSPGVKLPPKGSGNLKIPFTIKGGEILKLAPRLKNVSASDVNVKGNLSLDFAGVSQNLPYEFP